jgi:hypothetical protein
MKHGPMYTIASLAQNSLALCLIVVHRLCLRPQQACRNHLNGTICMCLFFTVAIPHCAYSSLCLFLTVPILHCAYSSLCLFFTVPIPHCAYSSLCLFLTVPLPLKAGAPSCEVPANQPGAPPKQHADMATAAPANSLIVQIHYACL